MSQRSIFTAGTEEAEQLRQAVLTEIKSLGFRAFARCLQDLFLAMGYSQVQVVAGRSRHGRTRAGGMDMRLESRTGVTQAQIIVQVKQYERPVSRRFVDELRGAMARTGARHGLLVATSTFAPTAHVASGQDRSIPVRLIDGDELAGLMVLHERGLRQEKTGETVVDHDYFAALRERYPADKRRRWRQAIDARSELAGAGRFGQDEQRNEGELLRLPQPDVGGEMRWNTHVLGGMNTVWLLEAAGVLTPLNLPLAVSFAAFGALLPDLDAVESKLKSLSVGGVRPFVPIATAVNRTWGHRGLLHSPVALAVVAVVAVPLGLVIGWVPAAAFWMGYASHIVLDALTPTGVPFGAGRRRLYLLPQKWRISTGSSSEDLLFPVLAMTLILLLLKHLPFH